MKVAKALVAVAAAVFFATCPWPAGDAVAGCVAPYLEGSATGAEPPVLRLGSTVTIQGDAFVEGCNDTGSTWACSAESESPMDDIVLRIEQGGREWKLGSADASGGEARGQVEWTVALPEGLTQGRATLEADSSEPLRVQVR